MPSAIRILLASNANEERSRLAAQLKSFPGLKVVAVAGDIFSALEAVRKVKPDVMVLDLEMPGGGSLALVHKVMKSHPTCIITLSSDNADGQVSAAQALAVGAADTQPKACDRRDLSGLARSLSTRIVRLVQGESGPAKPAVRQAPIPAMKVTRSPEPVARATADIPGPPIAACKGEKKIVVIGASTGGTQALARVLEPLPASLPGIAIVQHMPADFTGRLASRLNRRCNLTVLEAEHGMLLEQGHAYIAPGGKHLTLKQDGDVVSIVLGVGPELMGHKPSVEGLFDSVEHGSGLDVMAIMLTGMGGDGSAAMKRLHDQGALTIAQDEASCVVFGMPREAIRLGGVSHILPLHDIGQKIIGFGVKAAPSRGVA